MTLWEQIRNMVEQSANRCEVCEGVKERGTADLDKLGLTEESVLGTIIANTCGIVIDKWIYVLGQACEEHAGVTDFPERIGQKFPDMLVVATDVVGGLFAINGGRFAEDVGKVWYFAPDTIQWESLGFKYSEFIAWGCQGNLSEFYQNARWTGWERDADAIDGFNKGFSIYPFLWAKECNIETASKKVVPLAELVGMNLDFEKRMG